MKKMVMAIAASSAILVYADGEATPVIDSQSKEISAAEVEREDAPILWGFASYGFYSGYQLYGSIVNTEPTLQGYGEINFNLPFEVGAMDDLGHFGGGIWSNTDLTGKRDHSYRRAFNEFDFNIHWQKTFWFDDDKTWGLTYRPYVVWYYYEKTSHRSGTRTTFDFDHYFQLDNPYLIPYVNVVHEYLQSHGNLVQFGVKKPFQITDEFSLCPSIEFVWRDQRYNWCFSNYGLDENFQAQAAGLATMKLQLDATYMFTPNFGVFAKVAYCQNIDEHLRESADVAGQSPYGDAYGRYNEFCWGGVGICVNF